VGDERAVAVDDLEEEAVSTLKITALEKSYGTVDVLHGLDLAIKSGEFVVFVGPSGCGKSTLLRIIAGLEQITSGSIEIDGLVVNDLPPALRGIAMVFQSYALYPHMTVYDNMAFGLRMAKESKAEIDRRVLKAADLLQIRELLARLPKELSGGQRQRVAIGRAITRDPKVFLFDEPLSNLDAALRAATRIEIARLKEKMPGTTMIYVTHDQIEAMTLADRIVVLNAGRIEQVGTPLELYHHPANAFVAGFIGSPAMNFIAARVESEGAGGTSIRADTGDAFKVNVQLPAREVSGPIIVGVRPEDLVVRTAGDALVRGHVTIVENLGELALAYVDVGAGEVLIVKVPGDSTLAKGDAVALNARADRMHLFDRDGRAYRRPSSSMAM
jgi:alpha-glucoside transport system ATP-binding protein